MQKWTKNVAKLVQTNMVDRHFLAGFLKHMTYYCWVNKRTISCSANSVAKFVNKFCKKSANFDSLLFFYISALQKAINHQKWTIYSGIKSKFNLGGNLGLFQAVGMDPQAVIKIFQFLLKYVTNIFRKSQEISALYPL